MTNTELKYYTALQPLFQAKMGPWQKYDAWYSLKTGSSGKVGYSPGTDHLSIPKSHILRLPLPIDPVNPERGLWGMINNLISLTNGSLGSIVTVYDIGGRDRETLFQSANPIGAILKALCKQEGSTGMNCPIERRGCGKKLEWHEGAFCDECMKKAKERLKIKKGNTK